MLGAKYGVAGATACGGWKPPVLGAPSPIEPFGLEERPAFPIGGSRKLALGGDWTRTRIRCILPNVAHEWHSATAMKLAATV
jgi:hypothetical protein